MSLEFAPKDPSTGVSVLRFVDLSRVLETLSGGILTSATPSIVDYDDSTVVDPTPLTVTVVGLSDAGLITLRLEGGTAKTKRYVRVHYTLSTPHGSHTDEIRIGVSVQHT